MRRGILLAGGSGSRLAPITLGTSKHLLPVYDKPMIYYPLSTLMLAGIRDILVITTPDDHDAFTSLLGDGARWGIALRYAVQPRPDGVAQSLLIARDFLQRGSSALVLGDNLFYGRGLRGLLEQATSATEGATIFGYRVRDPQRYGVAELDDAGAIVALEEKPQHPRSNLAVTGLYFYDEHAPEIAAGLTPSQRGELEITDVNAHYLRAGRLRLEIFGRGFTWLDAGTCDSLLDAASFVAMVEKRQGLRIASPEEIAWRLGWIDTEQLLRLADPLRGSDYGAYLAGLVRPPSRDAR